MIILAVFFILLAYIAGYLLGERHTAKKCVSLMDNTSRVAGADIIRREFNLKELS
jgi:hypothetical protein